MHHKRFHRIVVLSFAIFALSVAVALSQNSIELTPIGTYATGIFEGSAAEISAYDPDTERLFVVNAQNTKVDVLDVSNPASPSLAFSIDLSSYGAVVNSVAVNDDAVAIAVENAVKTNPGQVVFFDTDGNFLSAVTVGALPDMVTFTPDGQYLLVANEGEPNDSYTSDPEGSVSIIDVQNGADQVTQTDVRTATFTAFNGATLDPSIRIFGPGATVAQDLEPEYIAVSHNSQTAWVTLQENNAIAVVDIANAVVTSLIGLGFKDHSLPGNGLDASDRDNAINITNWPVKGMYMPDAIASYRVGGNTYLVTANEGDSRDYSGFSEELRIGGANLDPTVFPNAAMLKANANLGRLKITSTLGDTDHDGDFDELYSFGARSFTIRSTNGTIVFDSGDAFEQITAAAFPANFNSSNTNNTFDDRSDDKGPEPEGVAVGKAFGRHYAFIGLERVGGLMVYDVTSPSSPDFVQYINNRNFSVTPGPGAGGDLGPEGVLFIKEGDSPNGKPLVVVANEISGTTTIYEVNETMAKGSAEEAATAAVPESFTLEQNFPNPFNPSTTIRFGLPQAAHVAVRVYNLLGAEMLTLTNQHYEVGTHQLTMNAQNLPSGTYFYRLEVDGHLRQVRQLSILK